MDRMRQRRRNDERIACEQDERLRFWSGLRESAQYRYCEKDVAMLRIERHYQEHLKRKMEQAENAKVRILCMLATLCSKNAESA